MVEDGIEGLILSSLVHNEYFYTTVLPYVEEQYFEDLAEKHVFLAIIDFSAKYNKQPTLDSLFIDLEAKENIQAATWDDIQELLKRMDTTVNVEDDWLVDETEKWCKNRAFFNAFEKGVQLMDEEDGKKRNLIPEMIEKSLAVTFDSQIGIEYGSSPADQWEYYNSPEATMPTDLELFNRVTKGGFRRKTLFMFMSTKTGGFKSGTMCHFAASMQSLGKNVLYITMELAEKEIVKRIDANLCDIPLDDLKGLSKINYVNRVKAIKKGITGRLIVKEYPTGGGHAGHFRYMLKELKSKKNFKPDIICVDYLNICASSRYTAGANPKHIVVQGIAEELRQLAMEFDCTVISATQSGRQGVKAGLNIDVDDISESYGLAATADVIFAIFDDEELSKQNKLVYKQVKNRFGDINTYSKFPMGVTKAKMKLHDIDSFDGYESDMPEPDTDKKEDLTWAKPEKLQNKKKEISDWII